ncbi:phospholipase D-like domain-containing protein [Chishuiella sp.]|uniref:phospholipase D-like domain-containing protein n=1 Tax=Chishuiella sp. TaxID=1969467 RepID=UPI0028AC4810|nr:phospholipase D-like domain-containing protein [Chishuiella sp.]
MILSNLTIDSIKEFISGDSEFTPYLSGSEILKLFNKIGFKDIYDYKNGGMPNYLSRNAYVLEKLKEINGSNKLIELFNLVFDPRHFVKDSKLSIDFAVEKINPLIAQDGYKFEKIGDLFKILGADLPDNIEVEVHFHDIQNQIIEQIRLAKFSIWVSVAWFTDKILMKELYEKKQSGINVRLVVLEDDVNTENGFDYEKYFETKRVPKFGIYKNIMHHKFCIIDLKTVVHGSYNWTTKARWNRETISIENSRELAEKYASEFVQLIK